MMSDPIVRVQAEAPPVDVAIHADMPDAVVRIEVANQGKDGYTPKRGVDYWTEEDVQEIHDYVDEQIGTGGGGSGAVSSVNGKTGAVVLAPEDIGAQPKGDYALKEEIPSVPTRLSQLEQDANHRLATDAEKAAWNAKSDFSGKYADLEGKPDIPTVPENVSAFKNDVGYLTEHQDISGKLDASKLPEAVNAALALAKSSGEFDGKDGAAGYTPIKGVDYWTESDRQEIIDEVSEQIPSGGGGTSDAVQYVAQELTFEQQAQARANISAASEDWVLIADITTTEATNSFYVNRDMDGKPFKCSRIAAYMILPEAMTTDAGIFFGACNGLWTSPAILFNCEIAVLRHHFEIETTGVAGTFVKFSYSSRMMDHFDDNSREFSTLRDGDAFGAFFTQFNILRQVESLAFPIGTRLYIWGNRV